MNKVIIISGATATGKTNLSLTIAEKFDLPIVNFDSLLFYKELHIGTAKPSREERDQIKHHLIDIESITNPINAASFSKRAITLIDEIHEQKKIPILVGGSGFYLKALLNGMYDSVTTNSEVSSRSEKLYKDQGIAPFLEILEKHDPKSFTYYHKNDHYRIRRAVEHYWMTGEAFYEARENMKDQLKYAPKNNWTIKHFYLEVPKEQHWEIMEKRTISMINSGLIDEVRDILKKDFNANLKPLQSIGYKQTIDYLNNNIGNEEELIEKIYIATRRLAKSQKTWFNKVAEKETYQYPYNIETILNKTSEFIYGK